MKVWSCLAAACVLASVACNAEAEYGTPADRDDRVGTLRVSLTGVDSDHQEYRLRSATFGISGTRYSDYQPVATTAFSDDEQGPALRTRLFYGFYDVSLMPEDWYIERVKSAGVERVQKAVLLTPSSQSVYVQQGAVTQVGFQFGVDGELIDFLGGDLDISIGIQRAPEPDAGSSGS